MVKCDRRSERWPGMQLWDAVPPASIARDKGSSRLHWQDLWGSNYCNKLVTEADPALKNELPSSAEANGQSEIHSGP